MPLDSRRVLLMTVLAATLSCSESRRGESERLVDDATPGRVKAGRDSQRDVDNAPRCEPRHPSRLYMIPRVPALEVASLREAATWSRSEDVSDGYMHQVAFDGDGQVIWARDATGGELVVSRFTRDGAPVWTRALTPAQPRVMLVSSNGSILVGGSVYDDSEPLVPGVTVLDPGGRVVRRIDTPDVSLKVAEDVGDGRVVLLGVTNRRELLVGGRTLRNDLSPRTQFMEILALVAEDGEFLWTATFAPSINDVLVRDDALYLVGSGPGLLIKLELETGARLWSRRFDMNLWTAVRDGEDLLVAESWTPSREPREEEALALWVDPRGCERGSVALASRQPRAFIRGLDDALLIGGADPHARVGSNAFTIATRSWYVARLVTEDSGIRLDRVYEIACDGIELAGGPAGELAVSCFSDGSHDDRTAGRFELFVVGR